MEAFVRRRDYKPLAKKYNIPFLLARICYKGAARSGDVPMRGEYDTVDMYEGRRCKENAAASVLKGRLKLKKSKDPEYTRKNCSWADLRLRRGSVGEEVLSDIKRDW